MNSEISPFQELFYNFCLKVSDVNYIGTIYGYAFFFVVEKGLLSEEINHKEALLD